MNSWIGKIHWRRDRLSIPLFLGFPCGSTGKESTCNVGDLGLVSQLERYPGEGKGYELQYSGLENSMDYIVCGVANSGTRLSNFYHHHVLLYSRVLKNITMFMSKSVLPMFSSRGFILSGFTCRSLMCFEFIYVYI